MSGGWAKAYLPSSEEEEEEETKPEPGYPGDLSDLSPPRSEEEPLDPLSGGWARAYLPSSEEEENEREAGQESQVEPSSQPQ